MRLSNREINLRLDNIAQRKHWNWTQEIIVQNKRQKEENEGGRQELEKMLQQRIQQFSDHTEQQRENNEDGKQALGNNLLKFINQNKMDSRISQLQYLKN